MSAPERKAAMIYVRGIHTSKARQQSKKRAESRAQYKISQTKVTAQPSRLQAGASFKNAARIAYRNSYAAPLKIPQAAKINTLERAVI